MSRGAPGDGHGRALAPGGGRALAPVSIVAHDLDEPVEVVLAAALIPDRAWQPRGPARLRAHAPWSDLRDPLRRRALKTDRGLARGAADAGRACDEAHWAAAACAHPAGAGVGDARVTRAAAEAAVAARRHDVHARAAAACELPGTAGAPAAARRIDHGRCVEAGRVESGRIPASTDVRERGARAAPARVARRGRLVRQPAIGVGSAFKVASPCGAAEAPQRAGEVGRTADAAIAAGDGLAAAHEEGERHREHPGSVRVSHAPRGYHGVVGSFFCGAITASGESAP